LPNQTVIFFSCAKAGAVADKNPAIATAPDSAINALDLTLFSLTLLPGN
jgi:hypothetical protein